MSIHTLRETLIKTTKILAGKDLPVYLEGFAPRVEYDVKTKEPLQIFLPAVPDDVQPKLINAIHGYIDHECAHVLLSDANDLCDTDKSKLWHYVHNCIEDPRINREIGNVFPGSKENIRQGYDYLFTELKDESTGLNPYTKEFVETIDISDAKKKAEFHLKFSSLWFAGLMGCSLSSAKYKELGMEEYYKDLTDKADPEMLRKLRDVKTTEDVRALSDYWENFFDQEVLEQMCPSEGEEGEGSCKVKGDIVDGLKSLEEQLAKAIEQDIKHSLKDSRNMFYWTDRFDKKLSKRDILDSLDTDYLSINKFEDATKQVSNFLSKDLRRLLEERRRRYYIGGYRSGKLNSKSLFSVKCGNDRVFKKKNEIRDVNACVSLLIDMSGSMTGERVYIAMQSAYALAMTLEQIKVPYEIYGLCTENASTRMSSEFHKWSKTNHDLIDRVVNEASPEHSYAFKEFDESFDIYSKRALIKAANSRCFMMQNEDSKHVMLALERLSVRPEKIKSLFVFSDGQPCFNGDNTKSAKQLAILADKAKTKYGVEVYGIGINSSSVERYYDKSQVVANLNELPSALFKFLRNVL